MTTINLHFVNADNADDTIASFEMPSYPNFQIEQVVKIEIENHNTSRWSVKDLSAEYRIVRIENDFKQTYASFARTALEVIVFVVKL